MDLRQEDGSKCAVGKLLPFVNYLITGIAIEVQELIVTIHHHHRIIYPLGHMNGLPLSMNPVFVAEQKLTGGEVDQEARGIADVYVGVDPDYTVIGCQQFFSQFKTGDIKYQVTLITHGGTDAGGVATEELIVIKVIREPSGTYPVGYGAEEARDPGGHVSGEKRLVNSSLHEWWAPFHLSLGSNCRQFLRRVC